MNRRLLLACLVAIGIAIPTMAAPQDLTTLLAIFLRNLHAGLIVIPVSTALASLPTADDGTMAYCSDCTEGSDPATGSSTGAFVLRVNGRWTALDGGSGGGAPADAQYWVGTANATLSAEKNLGALSTGLVINTTGTPSAYAGTTCTGQVVQVLSASGAATCVSISIPIFAGAGDTGGYNPAAGSAFYLGIQFGLDPNTTDGGPGFTVPLTGTINSVTVNQSTLGLNGVNGENITYVLRKNATTDSSTVTTLDTDVDNVTGSNTSLGFSVTAGDRIAVKGTPPGAWTIAPSAMFWSVTIVLTVTL